MAATVAKPATQGAQAMLAARNAKPLPGAPVNPPAPHLRFNGDGTVTNLTTGQTTSPTYYTNKGDVPLPPDVPGASLGFTAGKGYYARQGGGSSTHAPAQSSDPFAPMSAQDIQATIARLTGVLPGAMSGSQIQTTAQGELDPIIAAITKNIQGQASQASSQIGSNAAAVAAALGKIDYGAPYAGAKDEQAAVDAALQQSLNGEGSQLAGDLRSRLGAIEDPTVGAAASGLASRGTALGTTELAHGSNALSALIANAAAAKEYGVQQPGIVQRQGLQDVAGVNQNATKSIGDEAAKIEASLPGIVQALRSESNSNQSNRAQLAARLYETLTGQNLTKATANAAIVARDTSLGYQTQPKPNASLSRAYGYAVDQYGNPIGGQVTPLPGYVVGPGGTVVKAPKAGAAAKPAKPLTSTQATSVASVASSIANGALNGGTDKSGTYHPPISYDRAVEELRNGGLLADPRSAKIALAQLQRIYKVNAPASTQVDLLQQKGIKPTGPPLTKKQKKIADTLLPTGGPFGGLGK